ncbi:MAG: sulfatase activating formylglycine-generating enzyme [Oceanospirillaceae bacterium]|jgi:formylglycine-generating enzyme required for sulfatase activity
MPQSREETYLDLTHGQLVGPDHHKFQLRDSAIDCPLGQLWAADDVSTKNPIPVSLIMLDPFFLHNKNFLANFKKQIIRSKAINQPHVADIYGYFIHKGGLLFFAFEEVDGLNLQQLINNTSNGLTLKQTQGLLSQLTSAINSCTRQWHTVLGGIESQFVFVNKKGGVKFLPISMREFFHEAQGMPNSVYAYKAFCSPQALSHQALQADADSYCVAAAAYSLLGNDHFSISDTEQQRKEFDLQRPDNISDIQWTCLQKALSPESEQRFAQTSEFIKQFFNSEPDEPETDGTIANDDANPKTTKTRSVIALKLGKKTFNLTLPRFTLPVLIFFIGTALGFIFGIFSAADKIDKAQLARDQWRAQAAEQEQQLRSINVQLDNAQLKQQELALKNNALSQQLNDPGNGESLPLSVFRDPLPGGQYGPDMIIIAPGSFMMGDASGVGNDNEKPLHKVTFDYKFAIARYEVTFAQYDLFATQTGRRLPDDEGWGRDQQPAINVSWRDARAYTRWLAKETQLPYRLPSEAEWEYTARAGSTTNYWWGDKSLPGFVHCTDCGDALGGKQPLKVGSMKANPWGLYDLNGNVDEWVIDCYSEDYNEAKTTGKANQIAGCQYRSMRGGSWFDNTRITRSSSRYRHPPDSKRNTWGFRVALQISP